MSDTTQEPQTPELYDPAAHTVDDVNAYLAQADDDERARVLALEDGPDGKGRTTITREFPPADEGDPDVADPTSDLPPDAGTTTAGVTFADAAAQVQDQPYAIPDAQLTSTDRLAAEGKSKGATFAEQAALAREMYGLNNPGVLRDETTAQGDDESKG